MNQFTQACVSPVATDRGRPTTVQQSRPRRRYMNRLFRMAVATLGGVTFAGAALADDGVFAQPESFGAQLLPPPPPPAQDPAQAATVQRLDQAEREDSGRGLQFVWLTPEVGFQWASFGLLSNSDLLDGDVVPDSALGLVLGGGVGARLLYFTAGARFRYGLLDDLHLWTLDLEVALRVPKGRLEPYAFVAAGYARGANFKAQDAVEALGDSTGDLTLGGIDARLGGGVDYFVTPVFSVGGRLEADLLFLSRDAVLESETGQDSVYAKDGSGIGLSAAGFVDLGLHF